jgi:broad specificity phosphatase PhoE
MKTSILLVRHGQTTWNVERRYRGQADVPLDEVGRRQAEATARYVVARWSPSAVYASPLQRAADTAQAIADATGLQVVRSEGLLDINFGELQGMASSDARARFPEITRSWVESPHTTQFPGGESLKDVRERAHKALRETVSNHPNETVVLVAHTVYNRVMLCTALDLGNEYFWRLDQETCAVNLLRWNGERFDLSAMNDTSHLWQAGRE